MGLDHNLNYNCRSHKLDLALLVLDVACGQRRFLGNYDSLVNGGYHRIVLRSVGIGTGEEFPAGISRISCNLAPFTLKCKGYLIFLRQNNGKFTLS